MPELEFKKNDGGREAAGYKGKAGDCVTRAIAIATGKPYQEVYNSLNALSAGERRGKRKRGKSSARNGVYKGTSRKYMESLGWVWTPTMFVGSGCQVHLRAGELPAGRLVVKLSKHLTAVIDGVINDTYNPGRGGDRCVYGYWRRDSDAEFAAKARAQYNAAKCGHSRCKDPDGGAKPGETKVFRLVSVMMRRGCPRFEVKLCGDCYALYSKEMEGKG